MEFVFKLWTIASVLMIAITFVPAIIFNVDNRRMRNACGHVVALPFTILFAPFLVFRRIIVEVSS